MPLSITEGFDRARVRAPVQEAAGLRSGESAGPNRFGGHRQADGVLVTLIWISTPFQVLLLALMARRAGARGVDYPPQKQRPLASSPSQYSAWGTAPAGCSAVSQRSVRDSITRAGERVVAHTDSFRVGWTELVRCRMLTFYCVMSAGILYQPTCG